MLDARQENARMLAALLGTDEADAASRLNVAVAVTYDKASRSACTIADQIKALLSRLLCVSQDAAIPCVAEIVIGNSLPAYSEEVVWISGTSHSVTIQERPPDAPTLGPMHPVLSLICACYAASAAVSKAFRGQLPINHSTSIELDWATLFGPDLEYLNRPTDIGEVYLAGAGAIGNAFLLALREFNVKGLLHVCDPKHVTAGGLNRCLWFHSSDVGTMKASRICELAQTFFPNTVLIPHEATLHDALRQRGPGALIERLVVATDSRRVRRSLQNELPREVYDASTTDVREFVLHFNEQPSDLACLSCVYPETEKERSHEAHVAEALGVRLEDVQAGFVSADIAKKITVRYPDVPLDRLLGRAFDTLFKELCGEGLLRTPEDRQVLAPFAFVSVLAGAYLAVELVRRVSSRATISPYNYWRLSPWHAPTLELRQMRPSMDQCEFCSHPTLRRLMQRLWARS